MAPNSSQISALSASTMSNFALEAREEYTSHPRFLQLRRSRDRRTARWLCPFGPSYFFRPFLPSGRVSLRKSMLCCESLQKNDLPCILQRLWILLSHIRIHSSRTENNLSPSMTSSGQLAPILRYWWAQKGLILQTLKIHRKLMKIVTTIIFSLCW